MITINDDINIYFPLKLKPRPQQIDAINFVKESINSGKKYMLLQLPTGSGKSYFTIMFTNWYKNFINKNAKFDIITNSKILQEQYISDYDFIHNLKGRVNYDCNPYNTDCSSGWEICKTNGPKCGSECPYTNAKENWKAANIGLTNFHMFNTFAVYTKMIKDDKKSNVLIIDESHDFESVFCDFISTTLSSKSLKKYGFNLKEIEDYDEKISRIKKIDDYVGFIENQFLKDIDEKITWLDQASKSTTPKVRNDYANYIANCESNKNKFNYLIQEYNLNKDNWILDITKNETDKMYSGIVLDAKPVWGNTYMKDMIFKFYDHVIFMSGSLLDKDLFSFINGIHPNLTTFYSVESDFPLKNRPIYYIKGLGKMTYNSKYETFNKQVSYILKILKKYPDKKGLIHCGSYEFSSWLKERIKDKRLLFHDSDNRDEILQQHLDSNKASVLVSPSMISGVDLKDDNSRFQIIIKMPFPFLGSEKIKQRMKTNSIWYNWKTVVDFIQMIGRSVRSSEDFADTFILDDSFSDLLKYNSYLIPNYITNAIKNIKI